MIRETTSHNDAPMLTTDQWHVLRARWTGESTTEPLYRRTIESEHEDNDAAANAARQIASGFGTEMEGRERLTRDQVLVRRPGYKSLRVARRAGTPSA
jgi:hypothetical protein